MTFRTAFVVASAGMVIVASSALAGPEWVETGDAGSRVSTAQKTLGSGPLDSISGTTNNTGFGLGDFEDMYLIRVDDVDNFSMAITNADFDAQLFVFNVTLPGEGFGLLANDNSPKSINPFLDNMATDGSGAQISLPGVYAIAVSASGRNPVSANGEIFTYETSTEISGPDGPGGILPHQDWEFSGDGSVGAGSYTIVMEGVTFFDVPAPGALALLGVAAVVGRKRRRRVR